ncbi:hypothetical protein Tco_0357240 [Tanacetum coccineum]
MTSPPCHQASNQAPPSPPWPPSLALSPPCYPCPTEPSYTLTTLHNYSPSFHESPIAFLSHLPTALDPYTKYSWPSSSNSDQGGSSKVSKIRIEAKNQEKEALEVVSRRTNPKTPFRPILAQDQLNSEAEAVQIILTWIDNDIYSTIDACPNACEMWKAIERLKQCESINVQDLETNLYWEFGKFTSRDVLTSTTTIMAKNEVNELRAERLARTTNPLSLVAQQLPVYHPQNHPNHYTQNSSTRSQQAATRNRDKAIVNSPPPTYDQEPTMVAEDDEMSKEKEIDKLMVLISISFKKMYKPTNNNLRTSSNNHHQTIRYNEDDELICAMNVICLLLYIEKLKYEIDDSKNRNKIESLNKTLVDKLKGEIEDLKNKNKSLESSNNHFKEANNILSKTSQLMFKDLKKFQDELEKRHDVNYMSKVELDYAKAKTELMSYKTESQKSINNYSYQINDLNQKISDMKKELVAHQKTISIMSQQKEDQMQAYKTREEKELEKVIALENKIKVLDDIVYKTSQSVQTMNMLNRNCKTSFVKPEFLKKAQRANPHLYDIGHKFTANAYIDVDLPMNIMSLAYYNSIRKNGYEYRGRNFVGLGRDMYVFVGNMSYVMDFTILENIETNIDPSLSHVVFRRPFVEIDCLAINRKYGLMNFTNEIKYIPFKTPYKEPERSELSSEGHDLFSSRIILNEDDYDRGCRKPFDLEDGFYRDTIKLGHEYMSGIADEGEVT